MIGCVRQIYKVHRFLYKRRKERILLLQRGERPTAISSQWFPRWLNLATILAFLTRFWMARICTGSATRRWRRSWTWPAWRRPLTTYCRGTSFWKQIFERFELQRKRLKTHEAPLIKEVIHWEVKCAMNIMPVQSKPIWINPLLNWDSFCPFRIQCQPLNWIIYLMYSDIANPF